MNVNIVVVVIAVLVAMVIGGGVGIAVGYNRRKAVAEREIGSAEEEARRVINEAIKSAESKKRSEHCRKCHFERYKAVVLKVGVAVAPIGGHLFDFINGYSPFICH